MRILLRGRHLVAPFFVLAALAMHAQSPASPIPTKTCPWLTEGTAARVLGGEVSVSFHLSDAGEGSCSFSQKSTGGGSIKIEVSNSPLPSCGKEGAPLKGVGNEASRCRLPGSSDLGAEMVSGRVRSMHFTIVLYMSAKTGAGRSSDAQDDNLQKMAETVAGNLF